MSGAMNMNEERIHDTASHCATELDGLGDRFLKAFHGKEHEFLRLGQALEGFNGKASEVASMAADLAGSSFGEGLTDAASNLSSHVGRLENACVEDTTGAELAGLDTISRLGIKLLEGMRDFNRLVKHLTMLGIATRIESARLGSHGLGFSTLADDVEKLAGKIESSSEKILHRAQELVKHCQGAAASVTEMDRMRHSCSSKVMVLLKSDLETLENILDSSRQVASGIAEDADLIVRSVSEAVLSMQFHDIIRQQLEHVDEAAVEARSMALEGPGTEGGHGAQDWEELAGWMLSVLAIQESQMDNARDRFADAMQTLADSLIEIAARVDNMAGGAGSLARREGGPGAMLSQIQAEVGNISQSLREFLAVESRMVEVMREVGASIQDMSSSVAEIEEVGSEIELIALNASVKAAHTGDEGKALGVLASAIQKLSVDARGQTENIMALLGSVDSSNFATASEEAMSLKSDSMEKIISELDDAVEKLKSIGEKTARTASLVQGRAAALSGEIRKSVESLDFRHSLIQDMDLARGKISGMVASLKEAVPEGLSQPHSPRLREMLTRYTMEAERLVHESVFGLTSSEGDSGGDDMDNVELF